MDQLAPGGAEIEMGESPSLSILRDEWMEHFLEPVE